MNDADRQEIENIVQRVIREQEFQLFSRLREIIRREIFQVNIENAISPDEMEIDRGTNSREGVMRGLSNWVPPSGARLTWADMIREGAREQRLIEEIARDREYELLSPQIRNPGPPPIEMRSPPPPGPPPPLSGSLVTQAEYEELNRSNMIPKEILTGEKKEDTEETITRTDLIDLED